MLSLFADQERETKLDSLGDPLALLDKDVDFAALVAEIDRWLPGPVGPMVVGCPTQRSR